MGFAYVRTPAVAACLTVLVAGCGGSDSEGSGGASTQSLAAFQKAAAEPCASAAEKFVQVDKPGGLPVDTERYGAAGRSVLAAVEEPFDELRELTPPEGHEDEFARFTRSLDRVEDNARRMVSLSDDGNDDKDANDYATTQVVTEAHRAGIEAEAMGVEECTTLDFKPSEGHHG